MNVNLPPLKVLVRNQFTHHPDAEDYNDLSDGRLIALRSLQNQAMQFTVLLDSGALFTGLPANAICFSEDAPLRDLIDCQMWDSISSSIQYIQLKTLLYMPCTLKLHSDEIIKGEYIFSIDHVGEDDLSRDPAEWKMFHCIKSEEGNLHLYPQYRIKFLDDALCYEADKKLPRYTYNTKIYRLGS